MSDDVDKLKLGEAVEVLNERMRSLGVSPGSDEAIGVLGDSTTRLLFSGFDLDLREVENAGHQLEARSDHIAALVERDEFHPASLWLEGLLVGLIAANRKGAD